LRLSALGFGQGQALSLHKNLSIKWLFQQSLIPPSLLYGHGDPHTGGQTPRHTPPSGRLGVGSSERRSGIQPFTASRSGQAPVRSGYFESHRVTTQSQHNKINQTKNSKIQTYCHLISQPPWYHPYSFYPVNTYDFRSVELQKKTKKIVDKPDGLSYTWTKFQENEKICQSEHLYMKSLM